jgi:hypothetical protein
LPDASPPVIPAKNPSFRASCTRRGLAEGRVEPKQTCLEGAGLCVRRKARAGRVGSAVVVVHSQVWSGVTGRGPRRATRVEPNQPDFRSRAHRVRSHTDGRPPRLALGSDPLHSCRLERKSVYQTFSRPMTLLWVRFSSYCLTSMPLTAKPYPDLLTKNKPHLNDTDIPNRPSLVQNLHQIASLAESFAEQRPRSITSWNHLADSLDQEGASVFQTNIFIVYLSLVPANSSDNP